MFSTYKDNLYKYLNIKVYYRLNVFWDKICTSLHIEGNGLNDSLKFTKYNKRIIWYVHVHRLFKFLQKDENKVPLEEEFDVGCKVRYAGTTSVVK